MSKWIASKVSAAALTLMVTLSPQVARAGIPVIDATNLVQAIQQVVAWSKQLIEMRNQLLQAKQHFDAITGGRGLGAILNDPLLQDYIPAEARDVLSTLETSGYGGITGAAKALRDATMVYNCAEVVDPAARNRCQADLARPYQVKSYFDNAMTRAGSRSKQIQQLMEAAGATRDSKEVLEVQARIGAENALLQHEMSQIALMRAMAEAEDRIKESRAREAQRENASRTGSL